MSGKTWADHYTRRAKQEQWRARSVYKLEEIDARFNVVRAGARVLDLGCSPGSWSQYCLSRVGPEGVVVGVDLTPVKGIPDANFHFIQADINEIEMSLIEQILPRADVVLSDMAPSTTGNRVTDSARSFALAERAEAVAGRMLAGGGSFVCKLLEGEPVKGFTASLSADFRQTRLYRPKATRKRSTEIYVIAKGFITGP